MAGIPEIGRGSAAADCDRDERGGSGIGITVHIIRWSSHRLYGDRH